MSAEGSVINPAAVLAVFEQQDQPGTPLTAPEVADVVGCARRTAYNKLTTLTEQGVLATKKVGARGRVWWQPAASSVTQSSNPTVEGIDPTERSERALRQLHTASRQLMQAETHETVCTIAVEAAHRILGLTLCGLWMYDDDREVLEPVEWTESGVEEYGEPPTFPVDGSLVGQVFRENTYRAYDDITTEQDLYDPETDVRSELVLPLGEHGVLNASSPRVGTFDAIDVSLGRILAANVETALDRADQLERRRTRRQELKRQRDELETLNRINALIEDIIVALVNAATRDEIEDTVCERLATSEFYSGAWIVEESAAGDLVRRTGANGDGEADVSVTDVDGAVPHAELITTAVAERTPQVHPVDGSGTERTRACLAVPLTYADTVFGAVVVHAPNPDAFSDREQTAFETLGQVIGFVISATNNRRLLSGNTAIELAVALRDADAWFVDAADRLDAAVAIEGLVPTDDGTVIEYVTVEDAPDGASPADLDAMQVVEDTRVLAADDDEWLLECRVRTEMAGLGAITEYGATIRTARATDSTGTVTARFPATTAARDAMDVVQEAFPTAELTAKRVVDVSDRSVATIRQAVAERLTEKQMAALRAAFLAGYYDTPRETTAQELAESLDVAPSTLYQHLQVAHRKLLATVFDDLSSPTHG